MNKDWELQYFDHLIKRWCVSQWNSISREFWPPQLRKSNVEFGIIILDSTFEYRKMPLEPVLRAMVEAREDAL